VETGIDPISLMDGPKFRIHRDSLTYSIAAVSVETGIDPISLMDAPDGILEAIVIYLKEKAKAANKHGQ